MKTLLITGKDVTEILTPAVANDTVERAFRAHGRGLCEMPPKSYLYFPEGDLRSMPASLAGDGFDCAGIKSVTVHPRNDAIQLPAVMAVIILNDPHTGFPLAIMDGTSVTGIRTGAAGALSAKYLSRENSEVVGLVGCGAQARTQLLCLMENRSIKKVKIWQFEEDKTCTDEFLQWMGLMEATCELDALVSSRMEDITLESDIVITTTPSRAPLVDRVSPGTHITAIGADAPGKQEICPELLIQSSIVIDEWEQAAHSGEINVPVSQNRIKKDDIYAQLGDIVAGKKRGRTSDREITLFDATGLAIQDISCASVLYEALRENRDIQSISLF